MPTVPGTRDPNALNQPSQELNSNPGSAFESSVMSEDISPFSTAAPVSAPDPLLVPPRAKQKASDASALSLAREVVAEQGDNLARSFMAAEGRVPEQQARAMKIAKKYNLPVSAIEGFEDFYESAEKREEIAGSKLNLTHPGLAKWLSNPENAALAKDDVQALKLLDAAVSRAKALQAPESSFVGDLGQAAKSGGHNFISSTAYLAQALGLIDTDTAVETVTSSKKTVQEINQKAPAYVREFRKALDEEGGDVSRAYQRTLDGWDTARRGEILNGLKEMAAGGGKTVWEGLDYLQELVRRPKGFAYSNVENLVQSLPSVLAGRAGMIAGGVAAGPLGSMAGLLAGSTAGGSFVEFGAWVDQALNERGYDTSDPDSLKKAFSSPEIMAEVQAEAKRKGFTTSSVDAIWNLLPAGRAAKGAKTGLGASVVRTGKKLATETVGESVSELSGQVAAYQGDLRKVDMGEVVSEGILSLGHSVGDMVNVKSLRSRFSKDTVDAAETAVMDADRAMQSVTGAQALAEAGQAVQESKTGKLMPEALADLIRTASEGEDPGQVYFQIDDWDNHWKEKGLSPATAATQLFGDAQVYYQAKAAKSDMAIPLDAYISQVAPSEHFESLLPFAKTLPDGMTLSEAREYLNALPATLQELAAEASNLPEQSAVESDLSIQDSLTDALVKTQKYSEGDARAQARVIESSFRTMADRISKDPGSSQRFQETYGKPVSPEALFEIYGPTLQGQAPLAMSQGIDSLDPLLDRLRAGDIPSDTDAFGKSLIEVIRERGGIRPDHEGSSLAAMEPDAENRPFQRNLIQENGMSADEAASLAAELGYIPDADINTFLDAVNQEMAGTPRFSPANENPNVSEQRGLLKELQGYLSNLGADLTQLDNAAVKHILAQHQQTEVSSSSEPFLQQDRVSRPGMARTANIPEGFKRPADVVITRVPESAMSAEHHSSAGEATRYIRKHIQKPGHMNRHTEWTIDVPSNAVSEFGRSKITKPYLAAGTHLDQLIREAIYVGKEPNYDPVEARSIPFYHVFYAPISIGDKDYFVRLKVKEANGKKFYHQVIVENERPAGLIGDLASEETRPSTFSEPSPETEVPSTINIDQFFRELNATGEKHPFLQREKTVTRGFFDPKRNIVAILKDANLSTFFHESGHYYLHALDRMVKDGIATEGMQTDLQTWVEATGAKSFETMTTEQHEAGARLFEAYISKGEYPSTALRDAFRRFKAWMIAVYKDLKRLHVDLTPEVKGVFDRLIATQEEIDAAKVEQSQAPLFADPLSMGMPEKQAQSYMKAVAEAQAAAEEILSRKVMQQSLRQKQAKWKEERKRVREEIAAEVNATPIYEALSAMQRGTTPDGAPLPDGRLSIDKKSLVDAYGEAFLKRLPKPYVYSKEGGVHQDVVADLFGFDSGDALIMAIVNAPKRETLIESMTDERMRSLHGDLLTDGTLPAEAMKAVHGKKRAELLRKELEILAAESFPQFKDAVRAVTRPLRVPDIEAVRAEAANILSATQVGRIRPDLYQRAEGKAAREAVESFLRGDRQAAFEAKSRELLNHELYLAAVDAQAKVQKIVDNAKRLTKKDTQAKIGKGDPEALSQILGILEDYDFRVGVSLPEAERRQSLKEYVDGLLEQGLNPEVPETLYLESARTSYKLLSFEAVQGIHDALKSLEHMAKLKGELFRDAQKRSFEEVRDQLTASIRENSRERKQDIEPRLPMKGLKRSLIGAHIEHRTLDSILRMMDGYDKGGAMWENIMRKLNEASTEKALKKAEANQALREIFKHVSPLDAVKKEFIPEIGESLTKMGRFMVALNLGNDQNRQRMMDGYVWNDAQIKAITRTLTKADWDFVQNVWTYLDSFWPEIQAQNQRATGLPLAKVEARSFTVQTADGVSMIVRGGYFPAKYESLLDAKAYSQLAEEAAKRTLQGANVRATTSHGHRKERADQVDRKLRLDHGVIFEHVENVIHDLTHYETLVDINRLLGDNKVREAIVDRHGTAYYQAIKNTIRDVAAGDFQSQDAVEKIFNYLRGGVSISTMAYSATTAAKQFTGLFQGMSYVGVGPTIKGLSKLMGGAVVLDNQVAVVQAKSDFMKTRALTHNREVNEIRNNLTLRGATLGRFDNFAFWMTSRAQLLVDTPLWIGAYDQALEQMNREDFTLSPEEIDKRAIALADQAVLTTQGGGGTKDMAGIMRGSAMKKLFTTFYSFFSTTYNRIAESIGAVAYDANSEHMFRLASNIFLLWLIPASLDAVLGMAMKGEDLEDEEKLVNELVRANLSYLAGTVVGVRELGGAVQGFYGYEGPAGTRAFSIASRLIRDIPNAIENQEITESQWRAMNSGAGILFWYPSSQLDRIFRGTLQAMEGQSDNSARAILFGPSRE